MSSTNGLLVCIESPWAGLDAGEQAKNYLRMCIRDSLAREEIPWASHAMLAWTRALYEEDPEQRAEGLEVAKKMIMKCELVAFYLDKGESEGMREARIAAVSMGKKYTVRYILGRM
jgi:hypothetical protein